MPDATIHDIATARDALTGDELEVQGAGAGASARVSAQSIADLAPAVDAAAIATALGYTPADAAVAAAAGTLGLVQISDGVGGFDSHAGLAWDADNRTLLVPIVLASSDDQILQLGALPDGFTWQIAVTDFSAFAPVYDNNQDLGCTNASAGRDGRVRTGYFGTSVVTPRIDFTPVPLASLGSAVGVYKKAMISDGLTLGTWGSAAVDGGIVVKPVWSNGVAWLNG